VKFQVGQLAYMRGYRENWGVVKAIERSGRGLIVLVRWVGHSAPVNVHQEDWVWAREMRVIKKEPSK
jgi:hypothetical protein